MRIRDTEVMPPITSFLSGQMVYASNQDLPFTCFRRTAGFRASLFTAGKPPRCSSPGWMVGEERCLAEQRCKYHGQLLIFLPYVTSAQSTQTSTAQPEAS
jgi:hypothetical protein